MVLIANFSLLLPAGIILDRFSIRKVILIALSITILAILGASQARNVYVLGLFYFMGGMSHAFCF